MFELKMLGDKDLSRKLSHLANKGQRKVVGKAMRNSGQRIKTKVLLALSGQILQERTGRLVNALEMQKLRSRTLRSKQMYIVGLPLPTRAALRIPVDHKWYYPAALEYGSAKRNIPAFAPFRRTVDANRDAELSRIGEDIGTGIAREAKRGR
ncbi:MAG: hypothetical protein GTO41_28685 [Burkholderiales bacterium]|nr:hypothetical protein [Burkholderiales bacterium]